MRHRADLDEADHRYEHAEEPQPADQGARMPRPKEQRGDRDAADHSRAEHDHPPRDVRAGMRVHDREVDWNEGLFDVLGIRDDRVGDARAQRILPDRADRAADDLRPHGHHGGCGGDDEERSFSSTSARTGRDRRKGQ